MQKYLSNNSLHVQTRNNINPQTKILFYLYNMENNTSNLPELKMLNDMENLKSQINGIKNYIYEFTTNLEKKMQQVADSCGYDISSIRVYVQDEERFKTFQERTIQN